MRPEDHARYADTVKGTNLAKFFGMIANIDDNVGHLLETLKTWNLERDTLVIFMNDNGGTVGTGFFNAGMRGDKATPWLGGTRAASFWRWPGRIAPGDIPALTAHVDLFPTLASLAGAKLSHRLFQQVEGRNLVSLLENPAGSWPDRILFTHVGRWPKGTPPGDWKFKGCSIRNSRWHLVSADGGLQPHWQLFDLPADPGETNNVLPEHSDVLHELAAAYDTWWDSLNPFLVNEKVIGPKMNPFKKLYWKQFGGGPSEGLRREMDPALNP